MNLLIRNSTNWWIWYKMKLQWNASNSEFLVSRFKFYTNVWHYFVFSRRWHTINKNFVRYVKKIYFSCNIFVYLNVLQSWHCKIYFKINHIIKVCFISRYFFKSWKHIKISAFSCKKKPILNSSWHIVMKILMGLEVKFENVKTFFLIIHFTIR